jgi:hypothetical protein
VALLRSLEAREEAPGVALALFGDGVEEGWLYHAGLDPGFGEALDALVEERAGQGARAVGDGDDHPVEVRSRWVTDGADGVHGVGAVLAYGEDVDDRGSGGHRTSPLPQALPERGGLGVPGLERRPREA